MSELTDKDAKETCAPPDKERNLPCVILTGMPGSGKSAIGALLAARLNWAFMDTDFLLEALYASNLQAIVDNMGKEKFLDAEASMIQSVRANRCIIATGGSVVYREEAMRHLASLGPIIHLETDLPSLMERIALRPERGIAMAAGQTLEDLYQERRSLYESWADFTVDTGLMGPEECVELIAGELDGGLFERLGARICNREYRHD